MEHLSEYPMLVAHAERSNGSAVGRGLSALVEKQPTARLASSAADVESAVSRDAGIGAAPLDPALFWAQGADSAAVACLPLFEEGDNRFPGFESEMRGVFPRVGADGQIDYFTYLVPETAVEGG
jgi:hypothetical protein